MPFTDTAFRGLKIFEPKIYHDERGYFFESFNQKEIEQSGIQTIFVQDNQVFSTQGVIRGLHYQLFPFEQAKLVRVVQGEILDVAVDLREEEPTYGQWFSIRLSAENNRQLFVPRGFAHGYSVISPTAVVSYKCDNFFAPGHEGGIRFDDPILRIDWEIDLPAAVVSAKDKSQPLFGNHPRN